MYEDYPSRLRQLRRSKDITQERLAEKVGISVRTYRSIEQGTTNVKLQDLHNIAVALGTTVGELTR